MERQSRKYGLFRIPGAEDYQKSIWMRERGEVLRMYIAVPPYMVDRQFVLKDNKLSTYFLTLEENQ